MIKIASFSIALLYSLMTLAQPNSYGFHAITAADGLSDGIIRSIAQDKYGYMWFGTINGITVYNGYTTKVFEADRHNSFSLPGSIVYAMCKDGEGNMWVAQESGLYEYDYATSHFSLQLPVTSSINNIYATGNGLLYLSTATGLQAFDSKLKKIIALVEDTLSAILLNRAIKDICADKGNLYLATDTGIVVYHPQQQRAELLRTDNPALQNLERIAIDKPGNIWCSDKVFLYRVDKTNTVTVYKSFSAKETAVAENGIKDLLVDESGKLWLATARTGLSLYDEKTNTFTSFQNDPLQSQSLSTNLILSLFQSNEGTIWMGTEGYGVIDFNPRQSSFHRLLPSLHQQPTLPDVWCRAAAEDGAHNWWLATATGIAKYNPAENTYTVFQNKEGEKNQLYTNSVRSVYCANDGTVWIGTSDGLNHYHPAQQKMDFISENEMPLSFYWSIIGDSNHHIWFASRNGIYTYNTLTKQFDDNSGDSLLKPYCRFKTRTVFMDSRQRIWFGFDGKGLLLYDVPNHHVKYFINNEKDTASLTNNLIFSIAEGKTGIVWISTLSGLNAYDEHNHIFHHYFTSDGLPSNNTSELMADKQNRLWMGTGRGLCTLDSNRKIFTIYNAGDVSSAEFNDQSAYRMSNGLFVYPTLKGFLYFNPDSLQQQSHNINTYLTGFRVNNIPHPLQTNYEDAGSIRLKWDENFFAFTLTAPDYINAKRTIYAFRLEPLDKNWIYIKEQTRNYTSVPGGDYVLHYKAINGGAVSPEKTIRIHVDTVFYKQLWFIVAMTLLFLTAVYLLYRYRIRQLQKISLLQSKAQSLEKEKTLVMYESLKQQLNPHFLFNSLSSLSGLIQRDQTAAKTFLDRLSKIYRYILKSSDNETVPVKEDLQLAETYVQLQQTRFGKGLQVKVDIDETYLTKQIAPVTLQNLIENAIKHNIIDEETPLIISIGADDMHLVVQNNLQRKTFVEGSNKQGLKNMSILYKYLCGKPIVQEETPQHFTIKIPFV